MKRILLFSFFTCISLVGYSQQYSYSFEGALAIDQIQKIEERCNTLPEVSSAKVKYKDDSQRGEVIIYIKPSNERGESRTMFKASDLKQIMQSYSLSPLEFRELKSK